MTITNARTALQSTSISNSCATSTSQSASAAETPNPRNTLFSQRQNVEPTTSSQTRNCVTPTCSRSGNAPTPRSQPGITWCSTCAIRSRSLHSRNGAALRVWTRSLRSGSGKRRRGRRWSLRRSWGIWETRRGRQYGRTRGCNSGPRFISTTLVLLLSIRNQAPQFKLASSAVSKSNVKSSDPNSFCSQFTK